MVNAVPPPRARRRFRTMSRAPTASGGGGTADSGNGCAGQQPDGGTDKPYLDRSAVIGAGLRATAAWALRLIVIGVAGSLLLWLLAQIWVGILPVLLALILSAVLWQPAAWLRSRRVPPGLAAAAVIGTSLLTLGGVLAVAVKPMVSQSVELASSAVGGIETIRNWLSGPPVNLASEQIDQGVAALAQRLQGSASQIASGVFTGVSALTSGLVTAVLVVVLTFFFLKDGPGFLPWLRRETGLKIGGHLTEVFFRVWRTLGDFIRVQAVVSLVDAVFIGLGLLVLGVPLAGALAVLTFFAGFIPIVGAVTAGILAVLIALVSNGVTTALLVLVVIVVVQQLESNVLQPVLQGRSLRLHAGIVLLAITAGATLFGITGAFLAVPLAAAAVSVLRYMSEQISLGTGEVRVGDLALATAEGTAAARRTERASTRLAGSPRHGRP